MALFNNRELEALQHENQKLKQEIENQAAEIAELRRQLETAKIRPHNERGAGRKRKATDEQFLLICSLRLKDKSYNYIARVLAEQYGGKWNKTTVRNTFMAEKN